MKRTATLLFLAGFGWLPGSASAGDGNKKPLYDSEPRLAGITLADGAFGYGPNAYLVSAGIWRLWHPEWIKTSGCDGGSRDNQHDRARFSFGPGLRLTQIGHPGETSFTGRGAAQGQTLVVGGASLTALNVAVQVRWRLLNLGGYAHPLHAGFNIDLAGFTLGPQCAANRQPTDAPTTMARPVSANLLLINTKDRGALNSEFYLAYKVSRHVGVRAGLAHVATGYTFEGARYQRFSNLLFAGVSYCPSRFWRDE